ncbi:unnamed protein product [Penicillium olsonii]|nr:unnamed protein product [Penicillium olsonii]
MARVGLSSNLRGYSYLGIAPDLSGQHWKAAPHAARLSSSPHHATECHEMPLRFIELNNPQIPTWGETSLDLFLLSEWDKHHPDPYDSKESTTDRRRRLLRQFLALGCEGREIDDILRPIRPEVLRVYGNNTGSDVGCWLRLCYTNQEGHDTLWSANKDTEWVSEGAVVLDDESIFGGLDLTAALEIFPERVANEPVNFDSREESLKAAIEETKEGGWDEEPLEAYVYYQTDCVVTHMFVEDEVAVNGGGLLHVFLDDRGNVVRQWRVDEGEDEMYDGSWFERVWKGDFEAERGEVGPAYREGERVILPNTLQGL